MSVHHSLLFTGTASGAGGGGLLSWRRGGRGDSKKERENDAHRGRRDIIFYSGCHDAAGFGAEQHLFLLKSNKLNVVHRSFKFSGKVRLEVRVWKTM